MSQVNEMVFDLSEESALESFNEFLNVLLSYNMKSSNYCNDMHVYTEESLIIIQWVQIPTDHEWGGEFKFVDEDKVIMEEVSFPDGSYDYAANDEDKQFMIDAWIEKHPTWRKGPFGRWIETSDSDFDEPNLSAEAGNDK